MLFITDFDGTGMYFDTYEKEKKKKFQYGKIIFLMFAYMQFEVASLSSVYRCHLNEIMNVLQYIMW